MTIRITPGKSTTFVRNDGERSEYILQLSLKELEAVHDAMCTLIEQASIDAHKQPSYRQCVSLQMEIDNFLRPTSTTRQYGPKLPFAFASWLKNACRPDNDNK